MKHAKRSAINSVRSLPLKLNDGQHDYVLASQAKVTSLNPPISQVALYERVPKEEQFQYTPDLEYVMEISTVPVMLPIAR
jgi:hypothetical protein